MGSHLRQDGAEKSKSIKILLKTHLEIEVEGRPGRGLMLRDRGNNRNMILGVGRIQQRIKSSSPGRYFASYGRHSAHYQDHSQDTGHQGLEEQLEVLFGNARSQIVHKGMNLAKTKDAKGLETWKI